MHAPRGRAGRLAAMAVAMAVCSTTAFASVAGATAPAASIRGATRPTSPSGRPDVRPCPGVPGVLCGRIEVPVYRRPAPHGGTLTVHFRIYPHTDDSRAPLEPVVAFEGGPGYGSIGSASTYLFMLGDLHRRRDLIVMDQRGTGSSTPIGCPALQEGFGGYVAATLACARKLGPSANAYGTAAVADDLHDILAGLGIPTVDVYGDSYGSYATQVFAIHHPDEVRAVVLDGTYDNSFDPFEREASAALRSAWTKLCQRAGTCRGILASIGAFAHRLAHHPFTGTSRDADGTLVHVRLTATGFAQLVFDATYAYTFFRDLPAALSALRHGDRVPMLRLGAEDTTFNAAGGSPSVYSVGDYAAVACHDYPTVWRRSSSPSQRRVQLNRAIAGLSPSAFAPFDNGVWLDSLDENQLVRGCLGWPAPSVADPPFPPGTPRPDMPVLALNGEFDQATPAADAIRAAHAFPHSTFVLVRNTGHISALADYERCASVIARRFLATLRTGDTSCATSMPPVDVAPSFPVRLRQAPMGTSGGHGDQSTPTDRRVAWVVSQTIGDALARWYSLMYGTVGIGLRGGRYTLAGPYLGHGPLTIDFQGTRFVRDLAASGDAVWDRTSLRLSASLGVVGPGIASGRLDVRFPTNVTGAQAVVTGTIDGRHVRVLTPAPWSPQG
ncbi:MAG TPA: alpha/beta fold hydrolase [Actinomycetota bacterium]